MDSVAAYLPGVEVNHDHEGGSSRMRLSHCTSGQLTPTMVSNVDHLNAQFLLVGDCVRAIPQIRQRMLFSSVVLDALRLFLVNLET